MSYKILLGSKMLKLENPRDEDWFTFVDVPRGTKTERFERRIEFESHIINSFTAGRNSATDLYKALWLYQISKEFHDDINYPFNDFSILEHKKVWIEQLQNYMNLEAAEQLAIEADILPKRFYHILYQYHMIIEDTVWISDAAKADVQKIHDLEMPSSYFYELRDLINGL